MVNLRAYRFGVALAVVTLMLAGCTRTVQGSGDYPTYDEKSLAETATLVVEGTVLSTEDTVLTPRYEGDSPEENTMYGLSDEEKKRAMEQDDAVAATAVTLQVTAVHRGDTKIGATVVVIQTGGTIDGVVYEAQEEPKLKVSNDYLLFDKDCFNGTFVILGGSAGMFAATGDGGFRAVNADMAPFKEISSNEVDALLR